MPALALVKAGISMPSHSLRFVSATPTEGTKAAPDLGYNCAQMLRQMLPPNPKGGRIFAPEFSETVTDFSRTRDGFSRKRGGFLGGKLPEQRAEKINGQLGGFYLFARRKF